jgi:hypothetical protein
MLFYAFLYLFLYMAFEIVKDTVLLVLCILKMLKIYTPIQMVMCRSPMPLEDPPHVWEFRADALRGVYLCELSHKTFFGRKEENSGPFSLPPSREASSLEAISPSSPGPYFAF